MRLWVIVGLCFSPSVLLGLALLVVEAHSRTVDRDRRRRIAALTDRDEMERLRSGAAWVEAMAVQLDELRNLPEIEPWERWLA